VVAVFVLQTDLQIQFRRRNGNDYGNACIFAW